MTETQTVDLAEHVFCVSGRKGGEFCSCCGLHWTDECHTRSKAVSDD